MFLKVPSVLFVCLGNICRSPTAEAVFKHKALAANLDARIDSAGTHGYHIGKQPDRRSQKAGVARGYSFKGIGCRRVEDEDFEEFDYIIAMDAENLENLKKRAPEEHQHKLHLFLSFTDSAFAEVPDPYYGGAKGFELVLDLIESASDGLLKRLSQ